MKVRLAKEDDARDAVALLKQSIIELCVEDHKNDENTISDWVRNKTVETWVSWVRNPAAMVYVCVSERDIVGVCMMNNGGEILLNYVHPEMRFQGVSKNMLNAMEADAFRLGLRSCTLESTRTAKSFYEAHGYSSEAGEVAALKLRKNLLVQNN